jgi:hypothetical protein
VEREDVVILGNARVVGLGVHGFGSMGLGMCMLLSVRDLGLDLWAMTRMYTYMGFTYDGYAIWNLGLVSSLV